jgi:hypothetical protein
VKAVCDEIGDVQTQNVLTQDNWLGTSKKTPELDQELCSNLVWKDKTYVNVFKVLCQCKLLVLSQILPVT